MRRAVETILLTVFLLGPMAAHGQVPEEVEACRKFGLAALKEKAPSIDSLTFDIEGIAVSKADTTVEDTPIKMVIMGEAYLTRDRTDKPNRFVCLIGGGGKVLLTFFTEQ
jgi:hypothetical protein